MKSPIDFTLLWDKTEGYAVHCSNCDDAEVFIEWAHNLFPKMCEQWAPGETNYLQHESETVYTFDSKQNGKWLKLKLMYGSVDTVREMGYTIIELSDIYTPAELEESEMPLEVLFG